jgi:putative ABC transport system permease protein
MNRTEIDYALKNLMHRKLRSSLTVLSIMIGVMAVFALISFGYGIQNYVGQLAQESGGDKLILFPRGGSSPGLDKNFFISKEEINVISKVNGVSEIGSFYINVGAILFDKQTKYNYLAGFDPKKQKLVEEAMTIKIFKGRVLKAGDVNKVVLGYNYLLPDKIFKKPVKLNDKVSINNQIFEVVGFYDEVGNPNDDANIYLTNSEMESLFPGTKDKYAELIIRSQPDADPGVVADRIRTRLRKYLGQKEGQETFFVQTFADVIKTFGTVIDVINGVLVLIAFISLIVASVNIMNTMYTAVIERTKEIGIMKAIGAKNSDIMTVFVFESGFLGLIGGALGVLLGFLIASLGGAIAAASGYSTLKPMFPLSLIVGSLVFSFLLGIISGALPARQAAKLKPVDALRYE